jgi:hypothetical protein
VRPDQYLAFTASYRSDLPVDVVAEFELAGGGRRFVNLATVRPPAPGRRSPSTSRSPTARPGCC